MKLTLLEKLEPFTFHWWGGDDEEYEVCYCYRVDAAPGERPGGDINIAFGMRTAFGGDRRRVIVFRGRQDVLVEFVGADDWVETRGILWSMKRPGGHASIRRSEDVPDELCKFDIAPLDTWMTGPRVRRGYAVRVHEDDHEAIVRIALIRESHKVQKGRPGAKPSRRTPVPGTCAEPAPEPVLTASQLDIIRRLASYSTQRKYLGEHLFRFISRYTGRSVEDPRSAYDAIGSPAASLCLLLGYFAFARQGSENAGYNEVCVNVIKPYTTQDASALWRDLPSWEALYDKFLSGCAKRGIASNERMNRGLLRDIYALAAAHADRGLFHVWVGRIRKERRVASVYDALQACHGIGPKIAAFTCRDAVFLGQIETELPVDERRYIQPVDVWIERIAAFLDPNLKSGKANPLKLGAFLANACVQAGVSGAAFNQGAWYFGSHVARSASRLTELLGDMLSEPGHAAKETKRQLIVISCGGHKVWDGDPGHPPCPARDAYTGQFFAANRRYAEHFAPRDWMILSSRFGLVRPATPITDYNSRFDDPSTSPIAADQLRVNALQTGVTEYEEIVVLAGRAYVEMLRQALRETAVRVSAPYEGCHGIGEMVGLATRAVQANEPLTEAQPRPRTDDRSRSPVSSSAGVRQPEAAARTLGSRRRRR